VEHGDASTLQQHIVLRDHLHSIKTCMRDEGWRVVEQQLGELSPVVPDDWGSVMTQTSIYHGYRWMRFWSNPWD
jgi:hypothetical protein